MLWIEFTSWFSFGIYTSLSLQYTGNYWKKAAKSNSYGAKKSEMKIEVMPTMNRSISENRKFNSIRDNFPCLTKGNSMTTATLS